MEFEQDFKSKSKEIKKIFLEGGALSKVLPTYEPREGQARMAELVYKALHTPRSRLVIEAGTGTGKTCAYLLPAVLSRKKIVVSTGTRNLEEQIFYKDIPLLQKKMGLTFRAALMKGRRNYLCKRRWKKFIKEPMFDFLPEAKLFDKIVKWAQKTKTGDRSEIKGLPDNYFAWQDISSASEYCAGGQCADMKDCFVTKIRQLAQEADIVIINHALFFSDLSLRLSCDNIASVLPSYEALIFDEAHMLESTAGAHFGIEVSSSRIEELIRNIFKAVNRERVNSVKLDGVTSTLQATARRFFDVLGGLTSGERVKKEFVVGECGYEAEELVETLRRLNVILESMKGEEDWDRLAARARSIADDIEFLVEQPDTSYVYWREKRERWSALKANPIDLSGILKNTVLDGDSPIIFTSATLSVGRDFKHFIRTVGLDEQARTKIVETPFDLKKQAVLYIPSDMPEPNSQAHLDAVSERMLELVNLIGGGAFLLFTSYRAMEEVYNKIADLIQAEEILKQGDAPRGETLENFKSANSVLFATHSFWQGVDVMGDALRLVVIDKLPFGFHGDPILEAKIEWLKEKGEDPFTSYQLPSAVILLRQGLGRLLRHRNDKGVLALLDSRVYTKSYGTLIRKSLQDFLITDSYREVVNFVRAKIRNNSFSDKGCETITV